MRSEEGEKKPLTANRHTFRSALGAVRLHGHMGIEMIQGSVSLFTPIPSALVHALDLLVSSSRALVLLGTWNGDK